MIGVGDSHWRRNRIDLVTLGQLTRMGDAPTGDLDLRECLAIARERGQQPSGGDCLAGIGITDASLEGDRIGLLTLRTKQYMIDRELGDRRGVANALYNIESGAK